MPKTYKTEIIGYSFEELSDEIKQKIYQEGYDDFSRMVDFEPIEDGFKEALTHRFGVDRETLEVYYDLSYSQGSGACCVGELDVVTTFENFVGAYFDKLLSLVDSHKVRIDSINIVRCGPSNFYNHENTCQVEIEYSCDSNKVGDWEGEDVTELEEMLTNAIREELCDFHSKLQDYYEESTSFETFCEVISESFVVYTEDGQTIDPSFISNAYVIDGYQLPLDFDVEDEEEQLRRDEKNGLYPGRWDYSN